MQRGARNEPIVTTPTSKRVGFSVHPPAQRPVSPQAVPRPVKSGVTWSNAPVGACNRVGASPMTMNFLPGSGCAAGTAQAQLWTFKGPEHVYHKMAFLAIE